MLTADPLLLAEGNVDEPWSELMLKLRVGEVCRSLWRLQPHVETEQEFAQVVVEDIVRGLGATAAAIWEFDRKGSAWRLMGDGGNLAGQELRSLLSSVRVGVDHSGHPRVEMLMDAIVTWLESANPDTRASDCFRGSTAISLHSNSQSLRVLAIWSQVSDDEDLHAAAESIARDIELVFDVLHSRAKHNVDARLYNALIDWIPSGIVGLDKVGRCTRWNHAAAELFGWEAHEVLGKPLRIVTAECRDALESTIASCRDGLRRTEIHLTAASADGSSLQTHVRCIPVLEPVGAGSEVLLIISDETRQETLQRLSQAEFDVAALLTAFTSIERTGTQVLEAVCRRLGWLGAELWQLSANGERWNCTSVWKSPAFTVASAASIIVGRSLRNDVDLPGEVRRTRQIVSRDTDNDRSDVAVPIECDNDVQAVVVFLGADYDEQDLRLRKCLQSIAFQIGQALSRVQIIESLRKAEEYLQQNRKMEAIGMLAGGIAHDFNNLMTVILGNCELLQAGSVEAGEVPEVIEEIRLVGERAASLTRKLLTFSRKRTVEPEALHPARLLTDCVGMLERLVGSNVVIETDAPGDVHPIRVDRIEFEQVILNLVANARDAMPEGGKVLLSLANVSLGLKDVVAYPDVRPGDFVALTVADTGCGMDERTKARACEPFFTTKGPQQGTGLGLSTVYGIVRRSNGIVTIDSSPGAGTRFTLLFPRATLGLKPRVVNSPPSEDPRGTETILVVEDEDALRRLVQRVLEVHGYTVFVADSGTAALHLLRQRSLQCDLLLSDVVMPGMNGRRLAMEARKLRPQLPTLLMSGYHELGDGSDDIEGSAFLCKPFCSDALARAVRSALDVQSV